MKVHNLYIDREVKEHPVTLEIVQRLQKPADYVDGGEALFRLVNSCDDPETEGKRRLFLTRNKGAFIKKCPGTSHYACCDYHILHTVSYCTMDCAYCILQAYFHPPLLTFFVNLEEMHKELEKLFASDRFFRVGTGEFTDSLIWEHIYPLTTDLVNRFSGRSNAVLELKTKTSAVDHLLGMNHQKNTIMSWSLNTERVIREQERGTAPLSARIHAASKCATHGYPLGFHFDPIIIYEGCEDEYVQVLDLLFDKIDPDTIAWISLGSLRFMPELQDTIERRFPRSDIIYGEFIRGLDGKMRYFKPLRIRLYQTIVNRIRKIAPDVTLYFCMEDDEVWQKVLGKPSDGLSELLDASARRVCCL